MAKRLPVATHIHIDIKNSESNKLNDVNYLVDVFRVAIRMANCLPLGFRYQKIKPQGAVVVYLLNGGHISVHTYPECKSAFLDVFTPGNNAKPFLAVDFLIKELKAKHFVKKAYKRG